MRTGSVHCDRIIALIDACLEELGVAVDDTDGGGASNPAAADHEGGSAT
jgi:hypothetical protein